MRDTLNELQRAIEHETCRVIGTRFHLENQNNERDRRMAIEIKGLRSDALLARANIDRVREAYRKFNEAAPAHAADVDKLASDITGMQSDLEFAAAVMGNSADASEKLPANAVAPQSILAGVGDPNLPKVHAEPIVAQQTATTDRVALGPHPDQPEAMPETTEGAIWVKKPVSDAAKAYDEAVKFAEVEQQAAATFRAAE